MSYYRDNDHSSDYKSNYNEYEDNKPNAYLNPTNDTNLYKQYQQNQRSGAYDPQQQQQQQRQHQQQQRQHQQQQQQQHPNEGIPSLSADDFRLLRSCNKESFYYRCLPLSVAACALMYYVGKQRNIKPSVWHYTSATFGGWFFGKLSYRRTCEDRLINSHSNSPFVKAIRRRRGLYTEDLGNSMTFEETPESDWDRTDSKSSDFGYGAHEFADDKDLRHQPRSDSEDSNPQFSTTYDDLRARNRAALKM